MDTIHWGIIGCGDVTEVKSGPAFNKVSNSHLFGVMRRNAKKARDYAERHQVPFWTTNAQELLHHPDIQAIYVATPPDTHAHYTIEAAKAGKAVYVEKPMALTHQECQAMMTACEQAHVPLFVAYYRRCLPSYLKVKELIEAGAIGDVRTVHIHMVHSIKETDRETPTPWRLRPERSGGGHFVDLAPHQLDFLDYLFGPVTSVSGKATNQAGLYPAEDSVCACLEFTSGVIGTGLWCFTGAAGQDRDRIEIIGCSGTLRFSTFQHDIPLTLETASGTKTFTFEAPPHIEQPMIETVVKDLRGEGTCPSTGHTGARTTWVMDEILSPYRQSLQGA